MNGGARLAQRFAQTRSEARAALVTFVTAGDPSPGQSVDLLLRLVQAGADVLELGVPFSDPMADGPVIQHASERALRAGMTLRKTLEIAAAFRARDAHTPLVLMGYLNPIEQLGYGRFAAAAATAGVDGVLTVDVPFDEDTDYHATLADAGLERILLLSPTTPPQRAIELASRAGGFVYYVAVRGVTGAAQLDLAEIEARVSALRAHTSLPVGVGFGVREPEQAARLARFADAVVVGSALIEAMAQAPEGAAQLDAAAALTARLRAALAREQAA